MNRQLYKFRRYFGQRGAALVEMAIVIVLFLAVIFGILEFARAVFEWSRLAEATRAGVRYAIVNDPACNIYGTDTNPGDPAYLFQDCDVAPLDCNGGNQETSISISGACDVATDSGCAIVERMREIQPMIGIAGATGTPSVKITYACSGIGYEGLSQGIPSVSVEADNVIYNFIVPGLLGLRLDQFSLTMPSFKTTRTGEDMETVN